MSKSIRNSVDFSSQSSQDIFIECQLIYGLYGFLSFLLVATRVYHVNTIKRLQIFQRFAVNLDFSANNVWCLNFSCFWCEFNFIHDYFNVLKVQTAFKDFRGKKRVLDVLRGHSEFINYVLDEGQARLRLLLAFLIRLCLQKAS